jgi:hypothetical protein
MADYTNIYINTNGQQTLGSTDSSATWTANDATSIAFGGSAGANEFRWQRTGGGGTTSTGSAAWPNIIRPVANAAVEEMWAFTGDTAGVKIVAYTGANDHHMQMRFSFDALATPASAVQFSAFQDTADTTPTAGTQTNNATDGRNIINGHATDTSSTSYLKINAFGSGYPSAGSQETPSTSTAAAGTTPTATTGTAGSVATTAADWLNTHVAWQSAQGWIQYITAVSIAKATTAYYWYFVSMLFVGPNMGTGSMVFCPYVIQYTWT